MEDETQAVDKIILDLALNALVELLDGEERTAASVDRHV